MPILPCQKDGVKGYKYGPSGVCFPGPEGRKRAAAVAAAVHANMGKDETPSPEMVAATEAHVAGLPTSDLDEYLCAAVEKGEGRRTVFKRTNAMQQLVWAEVYVPDFPDSHGQFMTRDEIQKMAYKFLGEGKVRAIDVNHDGKEVGAAVAIVESFIARDDDETFIPGSWVVCMKVADRYLWDSIMAGELNGFSIYGQVMVRDAAVELDIPPEVIGLTEEPSAGKLHQHKYQVRFSESGEFLGGETDVVDGHSHQITHGSATDSAGKQYHSHRYSFMDVVKAQNRE